MKRNGFTIVELAVVIAVIAILAAISIVAYNGVQERAYNARSADDIHKWADALDVYKARSGGKYPDALNITPAGFSSHPAGQPGFCLGSNFPAATYGPNVGVKQCRLWRQAPSISPYQTYTENDSTSLMNQLKTKADGIAPFNSSTPAIGGTVGPYLLVIEDAGSPGTISRFEITTTFYGSNMDQECAKHGLQRSWPGDGTYGTCKLVYQP